MVVAATQGEEGDCLQLGTDKSASVMAILRQPMEQGSNS